MSGPEAKFMRVYGARYESVRRGRLLAEDFADGQLEAVFPPPDTWDALRYLRHSLGSVPVVASAALRPETGWNQTPSFLGSKSGIDPHAVRRESQREERSRRMSRREAIQKWVRTWEVEHGDYFHSGRRFLPRFLLASCMVVASWSRVGQRVLEGPTGGPIRRSWGPFTVPVVGDRRDTVWLDAAFQILLACMASTWIRVGMLFTEGNTEGFGTTWKVLDAAEATVVDFLTHELAPRWTSEPVRSLWYPPAAPKVDLFGAEQAGVLLRVVGTKGRVPGF